MTPSTDPFVLLTVRGTYSAPSLEAARVVHNETAGSPRGIAAARELGDLSHKVYAPLASPQSDARPGEMMFIDAWVDPAGIMQFFSNSNVVEQAARLFTAKQSTVWTRARGSFSYALPAAAGREDRAVGIVRGPIADPGQAIAVFAQADRKALRDARRRGLLSHELFIKLAAPGDDAPLELLGLDVWCDRAGMAEHYGDSKHMAALGDAFSGRPAASVWEQAPGLWSEW